MSAHSIQQVSEKHIRKFWEHVNKEGPLHPTLGTPCWLWTGYCVPEEGYGGIYVGRTRIGSHRFAWLLFNNSVPDGLCVLHRCDNPPCVNPDHLFLGTREDNNKDKGAKRRGNGPRGEDNHKSKLTEADVREIRRRFRPHSGSDTAKALAKEFGVSDVMIYNIVLRRFWTHVA